MIYEFMRLVLFFDLPMKTKKEVKIYTHFRKYLIKNGYMMMQFSVYCKIFPNREAAVKHVNILKKMILKKDKLELLLVTESTF